MKDTTKHIVSFSGGKDSTTMLLLMIEKGYHIDEILFLSIFINNVHHCFYTYSFYMIIIPNFP